MNFNKNRNENWSNGRGNRSYRGNNRYSYRRPYRGRRFASNGRGGSKSKYLANEGNADENSSSNFNDDGRLSEDAFSEPCSVSAQSECSNASRNAALNIFQTVLDDFQTKAPYKGWKLYFPSEKFVENSDKHKLVEACRRYLIKIQEFSFDANDVRRFRRFTMDGNDFLKFQMIRDAVDIEQKLETNPEMIVLCAGLAMHSILIETMENESSDSDDEAISKQPINLPFINARFVNLCQMQAIKSLEYAACNKMVAVQGVVVKMSNVRPKCTRLMFECGLCQSNFTLILPDGNYVAPVKCTDAECRSRNFRALRSNLNTETIDWQKIRLQDLAENQSVEDGGLPKTVECELTSDLVDSCLPGSVVTVTGVLKVSSTDEIKRKGQTSYAMYIAANSIVNSQQIGGSNGNLNGSEDLSFIRHIRESPNPFKLLISSICPHIYGHQYVKAGLLLALFGGAEGKTDSATRKSIHALIVGDPGLGKTHLLQACANVAPRGIYVSGNTTTVAGLTVALNRDGSSGNDFAIEAGALVIADDGCCCIDEFDKMKAQHNALLEVMEQQQVSIFKAGVHCQFPARASVLAAANPFGGCYDDSKTIAQNLHLNPALLSRFDLVFVLRDSPDAERDAYITAHVMKSRSTASRINFASKPSCSMWNDPDNDEHSDTFGNYETPDCDVVPFHMLKKYISYAKKNVRPTLSLEAVQELKSFFEELQQSSVRSFGCTAVGIRRFESLIRLTQARAKCELMDVADGRHARDVIEIVRYSTAEVAASDDWSNSNDASSSRKSSKKVSQRDQMQKFVNRLKIMQQQKGDSFFTLQELKDVYDDLNMNWLRGFEDLISSLNISGAIISKGSKMYQLL